MPLVTSLERETRNVLVVLAAMMALLFCIWSSVDWHSDVAFWTVQLVYAALLYAVHGWHAHRFLGQLDSELEFILTQLGNGAPRVLLDKIGELRRKVGGNYQSIVRPCAFGFLQMVLFLAFVLSPARRLLIEHVDEVELVTYFFVFGGAIFGKSMTVLRLLRRRVAPSPEPAGPALSSEY